MRVLLSKQEALWLSLLWNDRKYRAGEVDIPSTNSPDSRPVGAHGGNKPTDLHWRAETDLRNGFVGGQEYKKVSDERFPVHVIEQRRDVNNGSRKEQNAGGEKHEEEAEISGEDGAEASEDGRNIFTRQAWGNPDVLIEESGGSGREQRDSPGFADSSIVADVRTQSASECEDRQKPLLRDITSCSRENSETTLSSRNEASSDRRKEGHGAGRRNPCARRKSPDGQRTFPPSESGSWCDVGELEGDRSESAVRAMNDSPRREPCSRTQNAEPPGRESFAAGENSDPVGKMAERAAARRVKREELRRKYEEAQKRKQVRGRLSGPRSAECGVSSPVKESRGWTARGLQMDLRWTASLSSCGCRE
jgi:hypothetical protein